MEDSYHFAVNETTVFDFPTVCGHQHGCQSEAGISDVTKLHIYLSVLNFDASVPMEPPSVNIEVLIQRYVSVNLASRGRVEADISLHLTID